MQPGVRSLRRSEYGSLNTVDLLSATLMPSPSARHFYESCVLLVSQNQGIQFLVDAWTSKISCFSEGASEFLGYAYGREDENLTLCQLFQGMSLSEWARVVAPLATRQKKSICFGVVMHSGSPIAEFTPGSSRDSVDSNVSKESASHKTKDPLSKDNSRGKRKSIAVTIRMQFYESNDSRELIATVLEQGADTSKEQEAEKDLQTRPRGTFFRKKFSEEDNVLKQSRRERKFSERSTADGGGASTSNRLLRQGSWGWLLPNFSISSPSAPSSDTGGSNGSATGAVVPNGTVTEPGKAEFAAGDQPTLADSPTESLIQSWLPDKLVRILADVASIGLFCVQPGSGTILGANHGMVQILGTPLESLIGRSLEKLVDPMEVSDFQAWFLDPTEGANSVRLGKQKQSQIKGFQRDFKFLVNSSEIGIHSLKLRLVMVSGARMEEEIDSGEDNAQRRILFGVVMRCDDATERNQLISAKSLPSLFGEGVQADEMSKRDLNRDSIFRSMVENLPAGAAFVERENDGSDRLYVNRQIVEMTGYSQAELTTTDEWFRLLFGERKNEMKTAYLRDRNAAFPLKRTMLCKRNDGESRCLEFSAAVSEEAEIWLVVDITENMSIQENCRALVELSSDGYVLFDDERGIFDCNASAVRFIGAKGKTDLFGRHPAEFSPEYQSDGVKSMVKAAENSRIAKENGFYKFEWTHRRIDNGVLIPVEVTLTTIVSYGRLMHVTVWHDLTDYKKHSEELRQALEAAQMASKAKSQFLANMSHEIRTPMNGVIGVAEFLLGTTLASEQRSWLEVIRSCGDNLLRIISDVLDLSKIESKNLVLENLNFNIQKQVKDAIALLEVVAKDKQLSLSCELSSNVPEWVVGDPVRLRQVLLNLISNSIKFTEKGGIRISVRCATPAEVEELSKMRERVVEDKDAGSSSSSKVNSALGTPSSPNSVTRKTVVRFEVKDTGMGVEDDVKDRLFKSFTQADSSTSRKFGGTGLGLSICKSLCLLMGGDIGVESDIGRGSTFFFYVQLGISNSPGNSRSSSVSPDRGRLETMWEQLRGIRVLICEDNKVNQMVITRMVHNLGLKYELVENGAQAVDMCREKSFDFILMDCHMPVMDGYEATRKIRELERAQGVDHRRWTVPYPVPSTGGPRQPVFIAALTASALSEDRVRCIESGMDVFITKPIRSRDLEKAIRQRWATVRSDGSPPPLPCSLPVPAGALAGTKAKLEQIPSFDAWTEIACPPSKVSSGGSESPTVPKTVPNAGNAMAGPSADTPSIEQIWAQIRTSAGTGSGTQADPAPEVAKTGLSSLQRSVSKRESPNAARPLRVSSLGQESQGRSSGRALSRGSSLGSLSGMSPKIPRPLRVSSPNSRSPETMSPERSPMRARVFSRPIRYPNRSPDLVRVGNSLPRSVSLELSNLVPTASEDCKGSSNSSSSSAEKKADWDARMWRERSSDPDKFISSLGIKFPQLSSQKPCKKQNLRRLKSSPAASPSTSPTGSTDSPSGQLAQDPYKWPYA